MANASRRSRRAVDANSHGKDQDGDSRERIAFAAAALFYKNGYLGTSMKAIAKAVGISAPALYWHFPAKEEILFYFLDKAYSDFLQQARMAADASPADALFDFAARHVRIQLSRLESSGFPETVHAFGSALPHLSEDKRAKIRETGRAYLGICEQILRRGAAAGDFDVREPAPMSRIIVNMCDTVADWYRPGGRLSLDDVAELYGTAAVRMAGGALPAGAEAPRSRPGHGTSGPKPADA